MIRNTKREDDEIKEEGVFEKADLSKALLLYTRFVHKIFIHLSF